MRGLIMILAATLAACGGIMGTADANDPARSISVEFGGCFTPCPVYRVTVAADGAGTFEGRSNTAVSGERRFSVTPVQYQALVAHLAPLRPARGDANHDIGGDCRSEATDNPTDVVTWRTDSGAQELRFNSGCEMGRNAEFIERLGRVSAMLPIREFIGARR